MKVFATIIATVILFACNRIPASSVTTDTIPANERSAMEGSKEPASIPTCIQTKIDSIKKLPRWNPPAEIYEYDFKGRKVYMLSAPCCDFFTTVVDANCNYICAPSGGFTGQGDRKCPEFPSTAKEPRLIWRDERSK